MSIQHFICDYCGTNWSRRAVRGQRPRWCPNCRDNKRRFGDRHQCKMCGKPCRLDGIYCSRSCAGTGRPKKVRSTELLIWTPPLYPKANRRKRKPERDTKPAFSAGLCRWCGAPFVSARRLGRNLADLYCSPSCGARNAKLNRRAAKRDAFVANVDRAAVFRRDGWICQLCGHPIDPTLPKQHHWAVSIDHIVPLAAGGKHEPDNCQTAHRQCNSIKGARPAA